jgi:hypothetical protein
LQHDRHHHAPEEDARLRRSSRMSQPPRRQVVLMSSVHHHHRLCSFPLSISLGSIGVYIDGYVGVLWYVFDKLATVNIAIKIGIYGNHRKVIRVCQIFALDAPPPYEATQTDRGNMVFLRGLCNACTFCLYITGVFK